MNVVKQAFAKKSTKTCGAYLENFAVANYLASHAGVFRGARISRDEIRAPLKTPA